MPLVFTQLSFILNIAEIMACWFFEGNSGDAQESIFGSRGCS